MGWGVRSGYAPFLNFAIKFYRKELIDLQDTKKINNLTAVLTKYFGKKKISCLRKKIIWFVFVWKRMSGLEGEKKHIPGQSLNAKLQSLFLNSNFKWPKMYEKLWHLQSSNQNQYYILYCIKIRKCLLKYSQTCIKWSSLEERKSGLLRQVTS